MHVAGTFGQHHLWNINDHNTYMHPFIPGEILTDPYSLPKTMRQSTNNDEQQQQQPPPPEVKQRRVSVSIPMKYSREEVSIVSFVHCVSFEACARCHTEGVNYVLLWYILQEEEEEEEIVANVNLPG